MKRILFLLAPFLLLAGCNPLFAQSAPTNLPGCQYQSAPPTLADKQTTVLRCNNDGELAISGTISAETTANATAADPTYSEGVAEPLSQDLSGHLRVVGTITPVGTQDVNLTEVGGAAIALGQALMAGSFPVTIASNQSTLTVKGAGTAGSADTGVLTVQGIASGTPIIVSDGSGAMNVIVDSGTLTSITNPVAVTQSGTWTVQPGNTANTTPWLATISQGGNSATVSAGGALKVDASASTQPVSGTVTANQGTSPWIVAGGGTAGSPGTAVLTVQGVGSGTAVPVSQSGTWSGLRIVAGGGGTMDSPIGGGSSGTRALTVGGQHNSTPITLTDGQSSAVALDTKGRQIGVIYDAAANNRGANVTASNALTVDGSGVTQPVSYATTGSGNATGALRVELANNGTGQLSTVSTVTTLTGTTTLTPGTGASNLGKAEDAGHTTADVGVFALGVRSDDLAASTNTNADYSQLSVDSSGRMLIVEAPSAAMVRGNATITASTSDTSIIAASGSASLKTYVKSCQLANTGSSTTLVTFKDGSGGSTLGTSIAPTGGGSNIEFAIPLVTSANTAFYATGATSTSSLYVSCQGYKAP